MFTVKQATIADIPLIRQMAQETFPATYQKILSPEQIEYMMDWMYSLTSLKQQMECDKHVYFIAYNENEPCGYVSVQPEGDNLFHLQKIYVRPDCQRQHCGSVLFRHVTDYIKKIHPTPCHMELNVNRYNSALKFYEHMGMHKLREEDCHIGNGFYMNDYIMGLDIL